MGEGAASTSLLQTSQPGRAVRANISSLAVFGHSKASGFSLCSPRGTSMSSERNCSSPGAGQAGLPRLAISNSSALWHRVYPSFPCCAEFGGNAKAYAPARARWRRRFAFSLALRLLVLIDLLVCFITASSLRPYCCAARRTPAGPISPG